MKKGILALPYRLQSVIKLNMYRKLCGSSPEFFIFETTARILAKVDNDKVDVSKSLKTDLKMTIIIQNQCAVTSITV